MLAWAIHPLSAKVQYFASNESNSSEPFPFDPNQWIIGVFIKGDEVGENDKKMGVGSNRYKIAKK